jgi:hypothetical protein
MVSAVRVFLALADYSLSERRAAGLRVLESMPRIDRNILEEKELRAQQFALYLEWLIKS